MRNAELTELLAQEAERHQDHRARALKRASHSALLWPLEVEDLVARSESLTVLPSVGPWVARLIERWLADPPPLGEVPATRRGFITMSDAVRALEAAPEYRSVR